MNALNFGRYNTVLGWVTFAIALTTYTLTVEPTASFWDCGEYISTAAKLEVGHPPGAPFFQMMGAFFAMFATSADNIAFMVNYMSVISSAFAVLFLFWTTSNLLQKLVKHTSPKLSKSQYFVILGGSFVGALSYTFSDSFWFNAVEAEVYAMATLTMSLLIWLGLKWIDELHTPRGDRWLLLIAFLVGLSFGVHFMALLAIPAIGMLYYFKTSKNSTPRGFIVANIVSVAVLLFIFKLLLPYTLSFFGYLEVFFVNSIGLPFNSGTIIAGLIIVATFYYTIRYTRKKSYVKLNTVVLSILFIFIGFSTWIMIPIRANADTMINENSPSDARLLLAYYNLEQYPETHLFYGPMYTDIYAGKDQNNPYMDDKPKYERDLETKKYVIVNSWKNSRLSPNSKHEGFLPRMWSSEHAQNYMKITGPVDIKVSPKYADSPKLLAAVREYKEKVIYGEIDISEYLKFIDNFKEFIEVKKPTFWDNMAYMVSFQMNYMYWRYFMWNFVGRQDDIQGNMDNHGNWLSGIRFIDEIRLGSQKNLPSDVKNNKARNTYYFLPLILGILGFFFQLKRNKAQFWVLFILFLFTGLALKVYLNERPFEPRERDYALIGSFYVFAIWIGFGVYSLYQYFTQYKISKKILAPLTCFICLLSVPSVMAYQNWDDHDRSGRYTAQSMAKAYLDSVQEDVGALLFTIGDNDTFSLWYAQEVECYRTDVRTINTSLLAADWYIDQMKRKAYESTPIPSQLTHEKYAYGVRDVAYLNELTKNRWDIKDFVNWIASDKPYTKVTFGNNQEMVIYPTDKIRIPVNKKNVLESGLVKPKDSTLIVDFIDIKLPSALSKNRIMMLDILANNDWKRPIYFTGGSFDSAEYFWMKDYLQLEGLVYKLVPIKTPVDKDNPYKMGRIDEDLMFDIVSKWDWGNASSSKIYHDPKPRKNSISYRGNIIRLVEKLIEEDKIEKAEITIDIAMKNIPVKYFGFYSLLDEYVTAYCKIGHYKKARDLFLQVTKKYQENLFYYASLRQEAQYSYGTDIITNMERYRALLDAVVENHSDYEFSKKQIKIFNTYIDMLKPIYQEDEKYQTPETTQNDSI